MGKFNPDIVISQFIKDYILGRRGYRLDERFVLRDGKRRPLAIVVPGAPTRWSAAISRACRSRKGSMSWVYRL